MVNDCGVTKVAPPRSQPTVIQLRAPSSSTPPTSASQHVPVTACAGTPAAGGQTSRLAACVADRSEATPSSDKTATRQRHRSTPGEGSSPAAKNVGQPASRVAEAVSDGDRDTAVGEAAKRKTDLADGGSVDGKTRAPNARRVGGAEVSCGDGVIGRVKKMSSRADVHATPVTSGCLAGARLPRRTAQPADEHTGPVIRDAFETLRRRRDQEAAAARAAPPPAAVARVAAAKSRSARSSRPNTGRSSVVSVTARARQPASRRPSAAAAGRCPRKPKTPTSAASSTVGIGVVRTPRRRRRAGSRPRRNRSKSSTRTEEESEPEVAGASDVPLTHASPRHHIIRWGRDPPQSEGQLELTDASDVRLFWPQIHASPNYHIIRCGRDPPETEGHLEVAGALDVTLVCPQTYVGPRYHIIRRGPDPVHSEGNLEAAGASDVPLVGGTGRQRSRNRADAKDASKSPSTARRCRVPDEPAGQNRDLVARTKYDVFDRSATKAGLDAVVGQHKRSISTSDASHDREILNDQQGGCKDPQGAGRPCRDDVGLCHRRQSQSAAPLCGGDVTTGSDVTAGACADGTPQSRVAAVAAQRQSDSPVRDSHTPETDVF